MGNEYEGIRAISKSSIQIDFVYKSIRCKERVKLVPTPVNLKRASQFRAAILHSIEKNEFDYSVTFPKSPNRVKFATYKGVGYTLKDYLKTWLSSQEKQLKASTFKDYTKIVNHLLIPAFGEKTLSELRRPDVRDWCDEQTSGNKRLANIQSVLRTALQNAMGDDLIETNPLFNWKYERKEAPKPQDKIDPFDEEEQAIILDSCRDPQHKNLFQFAFWTGMRTSELVALEWGDIDWHSNTAHIWKVMTQAAKSVEEPKTKKSDRYVKLLRPALDALLAQKKHSFLAGGVVFLNPLYGKPWEGDQAIRKLAWLPALKIAGLRYRNPYQTRHTFASMMLTADESPIWVSQQMGHSDTNMIFQRYGRWITTKNAKSGEKAVKMFSTLQIKKLSNKK